MTFGAPTAAASTPPWTAPSSPALAGKTLPTGSGQALDPAHGFHQNGRGQTRYTISPTARRELLRRLLELNLESPRVNTELEAAPALSDSRPRLRLTPKVHESKVARCEPNRDGIFADG